MGERKRGIVFDRLLVMVTRQVVELGLLAPEPKIKLPLGGPWNRLEPWKILVEDRLFLDHLDDPRLFLTERILPLLGIDQHLFRILRVGNHLSLELDSPFEGDPIGERAGVDVGSEAQPKKNGEPAIPGLDP